MITRPRGAATALLSLLLLTGLTLTAETVQAATAPRGTHLAPTATPAAGLGIRLLDYPTNQATDSRDHEYIVQTVTPGTVITRHLQITNTTGTTQTVHLDTTAATISGGVFHFTDTGQNPLSTWTQVSTPTATIPNGESTTITVTTTVPTTATTGEQYAVIWAAMRAPATSPGSVAVVNRVGIREYINVDTKNTAPTFTITALSSGRNKAHIPTVTANVTNTGSTAIDLTGQATLSSGPGNTNAGPYPTTGTLTLAPGQHGRITIPTAAALTRGPWTATVTLRNGAITHTKTARLTFPKNPSPSTTHSRPTGRIILASLLALLLICATVFLTIRRRHRRPDKRGPH
jgi:hypothetical protein